VHHPELFQLVRVDGARGQQVVAHHDAVPALFRGPAVHPGAPGAVAAEEGGDLVVVTGEVVLGQQVHDQRDLADVGDLGLLRLPGLAVLEEAGEIAAVGERDVLVRHPVLGDLEMAVEFLLHHLFQRVQQSRVGPRVRTAELRRGDRHGLLLGTGELYLRIRRLRDRRLRRQ
jgi:hypothetical protein